MSAAPLPGPPPWRVSFDDAQLLAAWLLVLNAISVDDSRLFSIVAMHEFGRHQVVTCAPCTARGVPESRRMAITAAHAHRRELPGVAHRLVLCDEALTVQAAP